MKAFLDLFREKTPAQLAGKKAGQSWRTISTHTNEEIETLTGLDLYAHAKEEARKWLRSTYDMLEHGYPEEKRYPENMRHGEFLEYIEAFISAFPPETRGYPKD